jgi:acyl-CoA synthetase (AMP-forming)/AMP-acid ligase II
MGPAEGGTEMTLGDIVIDNARRFPDTVAYRFGGHTRTHFQLRDRAVRLVSAMAAVGVGRQDRIAVLSRNSIEFGELTAATQLSGIILATINFRLTAAEIRDALRRVTPTVIFCSAEFAPTITALAAELPTAPTLVCFGGPAPPGMAGFEEFIATGEGGEPAYHARPDDIACLLFTSGTTGAAKCAILGQRELRRVALTMNAEMRSGSADRALINMPMFHFGALAIIAGIHVRGGTVVLQQQFDPSGAVDLVVGEQITVLHLAPVMLRMLLDAAPAAALESVRTIVYSAAPMTPDTLRRALSALPRVRLLNLYGQTEAIVSGLPSELHSTDRPDASETLRSVGFPFPGVALRIVGDDGLDIAPGAPGEILVRSDSLFRGYWGDPAATVATLRDGWCHTGDIGRIDHRGLLYLVDRKKDVIITGGENVYCPEVEDALTGLDDIEACAVIGVPDPRWGEAVCAVVVPRAGTAVTLESLRERARDGLAGYKLPQRLWIVSELPLLASGKVDKKRLRAELAAGVSVTATQQSVQQ